jgi:hypothetical protein
MLREWEVGSSLFSPLVEDFSVVWLLLAGVRITVPLARAFVLWRGIAAAATLFGDDSQSWSLLRAGLGASVALSLVCTVQCYSEGWWGNYAAALELAWAAVCGWLVWKARGDWLELLRAKVKGGDWLPIGICLVLLALFMNEYVWSARELRVDLASWPTWFSAKGLPPALVLVLLAAFRPVVDELFFRGFAQSRFERVMPAGQALNAQAICSSASCSAGCATEREISTRPSPCTCSKPPG